MNRKLLVGFDDFKGPPAPSLTDLLAGVNRFWLLRCVTQLLGYQTCVPAPERTHKMGMEPIFGEQGLQQKPFARQAYTQVTRFGGHRAKSALNVLHPKLLLQLFEFGFERPDESHTVSDEELEAKLFMACPLVNTPYVNQQSAASGAAQQL